VNSFLTDISTALRDLSAAFAAIDCRYFIGGSFASSLQGEFRATNDLDIICALHAKNCAAFIEQLGTNFIVDSKGLEIALASSSSYNIIHEPSFIKIDLFFSRTELHLSQMKRAILVAIPGVEPELQVRVASAEDIILAKLSWFKKGGELSDRQWRDILGVIRVQKDRLDLSYLRTWAVRLEVAPLLEKAIKD
jgi:hypothetical protein